MSREVDQRVVEMRFDNQQFEQNVKTTMSTISRLKDSLNFTGSTKGLEEINNLSENNKVGLIGQAAEAVGVKFSAMQVVATTALVNIVNTAINAGTKIVNALTLEPVMTGFKEYETQINAIQTILANTSMNGTTLEDVTAALDELNLYADKTIYNFTEMARNIGTFTAAGVELQPAVEAIKGIANLAALSGSNSEQASRAMYQLSQALAAGRVSLMDWNSVVNAGMGGKVFQEALMDTAEAMGIVVDRSISFRESISSTGGKESWLTSEVLLNTLRQFTGDLTDAQVAAMGFNEEQVKSIQQLAQTANEAATKVKTFTQLWDTLKESAQSGWTQTWELIVGDFEEARVFLTELSDMVGGFISENANARNQFVGSVMNAPWDQLSEKIQAAGLDIEDFQDRAWEMAKEYGLVTDELMENAGSFEATLKNGWLNADIVARTLEEYASSSKNAARDTEFFTRKLQEFQTIVKDIWEGDYEDQKERVEALAEAGYEYADVEELVQKTIKGTKISVEELSYQQMKAIGFTEEQTQALYDLSKGARDASSPIGKLVGILSQDSGRELLLDSLYNTLKAIFTVLNTIGDAWDNVFKVDSYQVYSLLKNLENITSGLVLSSEASNKLQNAFEGLFSIASIIGEVISESFNTVKLAVEQIVGVIDIDFLGILSDAGEAIVEFRENLDISGTFDVINEKIAEFISYVKSINLSELTNGAITLESIKSGLSDLIDLLKSGFENGFEDFNIEGLLGAGGLGVIAYGIYKLVDYLTKPINELEEVGEKGKSSVSGVAGLITDVKNALVSTQQSVKADMIMTIAKALGIFAVSVIGLSVLDYQKVNESLSSMLIMFAEIFLMFSALGHLVSSTGLKDAVSISVVSLSLMEIAASMVVLSGVVAILSTIPLNDLAKGLVGVGALLTGLSLFLTKTDFSGFGLIKGAGLFVLATGLTVLSVAVKIFSTLNVGELAKGLIALGVALAELSFYINSTINAKKVISTAVGITILSAGMIVLSSAVSKFGSMNLEQLAKGLGAIAVALLDIGLSMNLFPKGTVAISVGLVLVSAALNLIAAAVSALTQYSIEDLAKSIIGLGVALGAITIALNIMKGTLGGSLALTVAAGALLLITPVLKALSQLSLQELAIALGGIAGALVILGVAGVALTPAAAGILSVAGALALMGGAVLMAGAGVLLLAAGLISLGASVAAGASAITVGISAIADGIAAGIPAIATSLAEGVITFAETIANGATSILNAGVTLISALAQAIQTTIPLIVETVAILLTEILNTISTYAPNIISTVLKILNDLIIGISNFIPVFVQSAINLAVSFVNGLANGIRDNAPIIFAAVRNLLSSIVELLLTAIQEIVTAIPIIGDDLSSALEDVKTKVRETLAPESMEGYGTTAATAIGSGFQAGSLELSGIATGMGETVKTGLETGAGDTYTIGEAQATQYVEGLGSGASAAQSTAETLVTAISQTMMSAGEEYTNTGTNLATNFANGLNASSETVIAAGNNLKNYSINGIQTAASEFSRIGTTNGTSYSTGVDGTKYEAENAGSEVSESAVNGLNENIGEFEVAGETAGEGFYNGIMSWAEKAADAAREMVENAIAAAEEALDSHSPSRVFVELGKNTDEGYIIGIRSMFSQVEKASENMASASINTVSNAVNELSRLISNDIDAEPVIRPVIDLSGAEKEALRLNSLFATNQAYRINSSMNRNASRMSNDQNGVKSGEPVVEQYNFTQNNYSPKALSRLEIYRQTKNQFAMVKGMVKNS